MKTYASHAANHLRKRGRLSSYLRSRGYTGFSPIKDTLSCEIQQNLIRDGLAVRSERKPVISLPLYFVRAINFELTYGCNLACKHCLQDALRPADMSLSWADLNAIKRALKDGMDLGLLETGVNFTGGEILVQGSPVLELVRFASNLGVNVRVNTNSWWAKNQNIRIGSEIFNSDTDVVKAFKEAGAKQFALSLDDRYETYPGLLNKMITVSAICESLELEYQWVMTSATREYKNNAIGQLTKALGRPPRFLRPVNMEEVDIGGLKERSSDPLEVKELWKLPQYSPCKTKGFYQPTYLHVSPDGGIRGCMYAPGSGSLGNIRKDRMIDILNRAAENSVVKLFRNRNLEAFTEKYISPWAHLYRNIEHPCSASAVIARIEEGISKNRLEFGREPGHKELEMIHKSVAKEYKMEVIPQNQ